MADSTIKIILSKFNKGITKVDTIIKMDNKYIVSLSNNNMPIVDLFYSYENGKIEKYSPVNEMQKFFEASKNIVYDRRKRR
jgi:hypothetical protein